ncbi:MAG: hypothetical protein ACPL6F_00405, partial [Anaerolineales bacterium]
LSHLCMAKILGVSIGRFSLIPPSWFLILIFVLLIALMAWLLGGGSWLMTRLRAPSRWSLRAFNLVIGLSLITHLLVWLPLGILRHLTD